MKWNDVELVDGKFYFVEVRRWSNGEPNNWVFAYRDNNCFITQHYVCAKIEGSYISFYKKGWNERKESKSRE